MHTAWTLAKIKHPWPPPVIGGLCIHLLYLPGAYQADTINSTAKHSVKRTLLLQGQVKKLFQRDAGKPEFYMEDIAQVQNNGEQPLTCLQCLVLQSLLVASHMVTRRKWFLTCPCISKYRFFYVIYPLWYKCNPRISHIYAPENAHNVTARE